MTNPATPRRMPSVVLVRIGGDSPAKPTPFRKARRKLATQVIGCIAVGVLATAFVLIAAPKIDNLVSGQGYVAGDVSIAQGTKPVAEVSVNHAFSNPAGEEMERLKTRNRRLEALVTVLRERRERSDTEEQRATRIGTR